MLEVGTVVATSAGADLEVKGAFNLILLRSENEGQVLYHCCLLIELSTDY